MLCAIEVGYLPEKLRSAVMIDLVNKMAGFRLRQIRLAAGLSMEAVAERIGVSVQQLHKYESGLTSMNLSRLQQMATAFSVPISSLVTTEELQRDEIAENLLLESFRAIDDEDVRQSILKITIHSAKVKERG